MYHQTYQHNKNETRRVYKLIILFSDKVREKGEICENTTISDLHPLLSLVLSIPQSAAKTPMGWKQGRLASQNQSLSLELAHL